MTKQFDLLVIGGGSGGLATAKKAVSFGASVALIESGLLGGTCVNVGCVPKKIMWYAGEIAAMFRMAPNYGFSHCDATHDFEKLVARRQEFINKINLKYAQQLRDKKVNYIRGHAEFLDAKTISVNKEIYQASHIVIATGCLPKQHTIPGREFAIDSNGFFALKEQPKKVAIAGAGYVAVELASLLNQLGSEVIVLLRYETLLRDFDAFICEHIMQIFATQGIQILAHHEVSEIKQNRSGQLAIFCGDNPPIADVDTLIFAIGREPQIQHLNLSATGVATDVDGFIRTDKWETTNITHIYAIGDITGKKLLTPVAIAAGRCLATRLFGPDQKAHLDYENIPTVIFSHPSIGSIGLSEQEAVKKYGKDQLKIYQTKFNSLYYSLSEDKTPSFMKLITLKPDEKIIGCHLIGPGVDEMLQGFAVAIKMGATKRNFDNTVAIHPTSAEELVTIDT